MIKKEPSSFKIESSIPTKDTLGEDYIYDMDLSYTIQECSRLSQSAYTLKVGEDIHIYYAWTMVILCGSAPA